MDKRFVVFGILAACGEVRGVTVEDGDVAGVAVVSVRSPDEGTATVTFEDKNTGEILTTTGELPGDLTQLGLSAGSSYTVHVDVTESDGTVKEGRAIDFQAASPPSSGPTFVQQVYEPDRMCDPEGFLLTSWLGAQTGVAIIDRAGNYRWSVPSVSRQQQINRARISRDGKDIHFMFVDVDRIDTEVSSVVTRPLDGGEATITKVFSGHHDFVEHPDETTIGWLGYDFRDVPAVDVVGLPNPWDGADPLPTAADTILEGRFGDDGTMEPVTIFNFYDDYFPDHPITYTTDTNFAIDDFLPGVHELTHGNSLALVGDTYLTMLRWTDSVVGVSRTTGEYWTLGGVYNEFTPVEGQNLDILFREPHFSDAWEDADGLHMLVFDNRLPDVDSKLAEYVLDVENRTVERVWEYQADAHEAVLGDVQRFHIEGCDNLLVAFSGRGRLVELTRDGDIVWEVRIRVGAGLARVQYLPSFDDPASAIYP